MATFRVHLREKLIGSIEVEAQDRPRAIAKAKSLIGRNELPDGVMDESQGITVASVEEV